MYTSRSIVQIHPWVDESLSHLRKTVAMSKRTPRFSWHILGDFAALLFVTGAVTTPFQGKGDWDVSIPVVVTAFVIGVALFLRRKAPVTILAVTVTLTLVLMFLGVSGPVIGLPLAIAVYSVALRLPRRQAWLLSALSALVLMATFIFATDFQFFDPAWIALLAIPAFATAAGSYSRSRRELLKSTEARAQAAEENREAEARQRVAEERLRIARDLHDVVGHHIAAIGLHADLADRALIDHPEIARESLDVVRTSAHEALSEISDMMKVLRENTEMAPSPSLKNMSDLLTRFRRSGHSVTVNAQGNLENLPAFSDSVAYRVIQEGLTNASKYSADATSRVDVTRREDSIHITILNPIDSAQPTTNKQGFGLMGMRERLAAVGGTMEISTDDNSGFQLMVHIPLSREQQL